MATASSIFSVSSKIHVKGASHSSNHGTLTGLNTGTSSGQYLSLGATGSLIYSNATSWATIQKTKYIILDKEVEVTGYTDPVVAMYISMINLAGKKFYDEVKKQGVNFPKEIEEFLQKELIPWERNRKLDIIL